MRTILVLSVFVSTASMLGCSKPPSGERPQAPPAAVRVANPLRKEIVEWKEFTGRMEAVDFVEIRSRVSGYLHSMHFSEGQDVKKDALLFVVDPRPFQAELEKAEAALAEAKARVEQSNAQLEQATASKETASSQLRFANTEMERQLTLQNRSATSQSEVDQARNELSKAQASLESANAGIASAKGAIATSKAAIVTAEAAVNEAKLNLEYTNIKAPISGRISRRYVTEGNLISGGSEQSTLLTTIVSLDPIYFMFDASEQEVLRFQRMVLQGERRDVREVNYPVHLALADETGYPHQGYLDFVDNRFDPNTATMTARAMFPNANGILTPGMFGKMQIANTLPYEALLLPDAAIGADQSENFVYVIDEDNTARLQVVETGPLALGLRVIRSGITATDRIVVGGLQRVRPGAPVEAKTEVITADESNTVKYDSAPMEKG
ncbi:Efflux pump periplasmic linker BepF [Novipirellula galeiformis]|uniref:Efflux pump periplasmic linker BepF n=1 Tax=Novipirellula galeiformis TaxID=2528004 RepID=A0A5C6CM92_9BACT|nr:efflux RND transporter periplasmic adaptor subunit [Novipirellula galeiformis]TWU25472.1 Efflux pump periplasmic linker BepF [Novipirellula galeiformis]